jgi:acyl-CoA thioester hydrolase
MSDPASGQPTPASHTIRLRVRHSDVDVLGHVNNAVYLLYAQEAAYRHAESAGFSLARMRELGGVFVVRRHEVEYHRPARAGDELLVTTQITHMQGMRATRKTTIVDAASGKQVVTASTDYVWVNHNGRPARIPAEALARFAIVEEV